MVEIAGKVDVIDPDFAGSLNSDGVTGIGEDLGDLDVTDDNVGDVNDAETNANER